MTATNDLVVRTWRATATRAGAREYHRYFAGTLLPQLRDVPGFAGGYLLSRDTDGTVELTTHTFWESPAAIRAFAGDDITSSVVEPEAQSVLLDFDPAVTHRSVLVDARG
jgi:heme-degrading monooxygenase HmoA